MVFAIVRSNRADEDLIEIWLEIAKGNPVAADRVLDAIELRWQQLARYPYSGMARDDIAEGIRHLVAGGYLTLYRIAGNSIEIVRVLHGPSLRSPLRPSAAWKSAPADSVNPFLPAIRH